MGDKTSNLASKEEMSTFGIKYLRSHLYAWLMIAFAITQFYVNESEKNHNNQITRPTPVSARQEGTPVYVSGKIKLHSPQSPYVKPGNFLRIEQVAEVYGFSEWTGSRGKLLRGLAWTDNPKDPKTFGSEEYANEKMYTRQYESHVWGDEKASIESAGSTYTFDSRQVEPNFKLDDKAPAAAEPATGKLRYFGPNPNESSEWLHLYETKECSIEPKPNCQRLRLKVLAVPDGEVTLIGDAKGQNLVPFRERLIIGPGDLTAVLDSTYVGNANATFAEFGYFLLLCIALYLARELTAFIPVASKLATARRTLLLAVSLTLLCVYAAGLWYLWLIGSLAAWYYLNKLRLGAASKAA